MPDNMWTLAAMLAACETFLIGGFFLLDPVVDKIVRVFQ